MPGYGPSIALIVVDMQNDFADPAGSLFVEGADDVIAAVNTQVIQAVSAGSPVLYTQDWHPPSTPHFAKDGGIWPVHCVADSWGSALHDRILVTGPIIRKGSNGEDGYSGFSMRDPVQGGVIPTALGGHLEGIAEVVVVGLALDYCVKETALDAVRLGYATRVIRSATAAVDIQPGDGAAAESDLQAAAVGIV